MRLSKTSWSVAACVVVLGGFGVAAAQTGGEPPAAELTAPREVNLSPAQQLSKGEMFMQGMEQAAVTVRSQLKQAREARDVVKVLCLNDKLNQLDVAIRSARDRIGVLRAAVQRNDTDRSRHEFTILQVLKERSDAVVAEANQCIGEETGFIGDSQVTVDIDPTIPDTDPADLGSDPTIISIPPVVSSPLE